MGLDDILSLGPDMGARKEEKDAKAFLPQNVVHVGPKIDPKQVSMMDAVWKVTFRTQGEQELLVVVPESYPLSKVLQWVEARLAHIHRGGFMILGTQRIEITAGVLPREL